MKSTEKIKKQGGKRMKERVVFLGLVLALLVGSCAPPTPQIIEVTREVPVTVVVTATPPPAAPTPVYPDIELGEVKLEEDELIFSWSWPYDGDFAKLKGAEFHVWCWREGEFLPSRSILTAEYSDKWGAPYKRFTPGEEYSWQVQLLRGDKVLAESPVGTFVVPTPTPAASP